MDLTVSIEEASSHLPELLARLAGDASEIVIARDGKPVARLLPPHAASNLGTTLRTPGSDRGRFHVPAEFFDPLPV